jgi:hypothetical protein
MALYTPDYKYEDAKRCFDDLPEEKKKHIKYLLQSKDDYIKTLVDRIEDMSKVFRDIKRFTG